MRHEWLHVVEEPVGTTLVEQQLLAHVERRAHRGAVVAKPPVEKVDQIGGLLRDKPLDQLVDLHGAKNHPANRRKLLVKVWLAVARIAYQRGSDRNAQFERTVLERHELLKVLELLRNVELDAGHCHAPVEVAPIQADEFGTELLGQLPEWAAVLRTNSNSLLVQRIVPSKIKRDLIPCVEMKLRKLQRRFKVGIAIPEFDKENFFQNESLAGASRTPFVSPGKACRLADQ